MPFCPKCRYEYTPEIVECPDCGSKLVAELPPESEQSSDGVNWVKLVALANDAQVQLTKGLLESSGIPVVVMPPIITWTGIYRPGTESDQSIYVPSSRAKEARRILARGGKG